MSATSRGSAGTERALVMIVRALLLVACVGCTSSSDRPSCPPVRQLSCPDCGPGELRAAVEVDGTSGYAPAIFRDGSLAISACSDVVRLDAGGSVRAEYTSLPADSKPGRVVTGSSGSMYVQNGIPMVPDQDPGDATPLVTLDASGGFLGQIPVILPAALWSNAAGAYIGTRDMRYGGVMVIGPQGTLWRQASVYAPDTSAGIFTGTSTVDSAKPAVIAHVDAGGQTVWTKNANAMAPLTFDAIAADGNGVVVVGHIPGGGAAVDFGDMTLALSSTGFDTVSFIAAFDATGATTWAHAFHVASLRNVSIAVSGGVAITSMACTDASSLVAGANSGAIVAFDATGVVSAYPVSGASPSEVTLAPDGSVWLALVGTSLTFGSHSITTTGDRLGWLVNVAL